MVMMSSVLSLPPQYSNGDLNKGYVVVEPLKGYDAPLVGGLCVLDPVANHARVQIDNRGHS